MTIEQVNNDYRRKVMTDPMFRRVVGLVERENAKRAREVKANRDYAEAIKPFTKKEAAAPAPKVVMAVRVPMHKRVLEHLNGHPVSSESLRRSIGGSKSNMDKTLRTLNFNGKIVRRDDGWILTQNAKGDGANE